MNRSLWSWLFEAYREPRRSARRIINAQLGFDAVALMVVASAAITTVLLSLFLNAVPVPPEVQQRPDFQIPSVAEIGVSTLVQSIAGVLIISVLALFIGRLAGGRGEWSDILSVIAWYGLANVLGFSVGLVLTMAAPFLGMVAWGFIAVYLFYMLAAFVAEVHGFASAGRVMAVAFGIAFFIALLLTFAGVSVMAPPSGL
ncbi:MAG: Yip1 family protein [Pseudomonadota bacterium]